MLSQLLANRLLVEQPSIYRGAHHLGKEDSFVETRGKKDACPSPKSLLQRHAVSALTILFLFTFTFTLQFLMDAGHNELANSPDEPAHVVSSLMVHDYLSSGMHEWPRSFAEKYYAHYPKVAIGIWPPLFYVLAALWMFPMGVSRLSLLLLNGAIVAALSSSVALLVQRLYGAVLGLTAGVVFLFLHSSQEGSATLMLDMAVGLGCFWAMLLMESYLRTLKIRVAATLGLVIGLAMMVKGNADALILMVLFMLPMARRWDLLRKPSLYVTALTVFVIGLPWQIINAYFLTRQNIYLPPSAGRPFQTLAGYAEILIRDFTPLPTALLLVGLSTVLWRIRTRTAQPLALVAAASLFLAVIIFHCIVPKIGSLSPRYLLPALPPGIVLFFAGCHYVSRFRLSPGASPAWRLSLLVGCSLLSASYLGAFRRPEFQSLGFVKAADLAVKANTPPSPMLICSDSIGEGAFVSEVALRDRHLVRVVLRGSKMLSESSWVGETFRMLFDNDADLARALDGNGVDVVVIDLTATEYPPERALLLSALHRQPDTWAASTLAHGPGGTRDLQIFTRKERAHFVRGKLRVPMPFTLGHDLTVP